uniref:GS catalytic domain-containing protein n=1 Tax=Hordeum vulgare subsp. vulgare TaxID=112509 RepID=A0A8I7BGC8_HORVV
MDMEAKYADLRRAAEETAVVDAHAHDLLAAGSTLPFTRCFSEADGDALTLAPHSLPFKRSLRDIAALYDCDASFEKVEEFRRAQGLSSITSKCFQAANISALVVDDVSKFNEILELESHNAFAPKVYRIVGIETLAETIINEESLSGSSWTLDSFTEAFVAKLKSYPTQFRMLSVFTNKIVGLKSIAAHRSGLDIDPSVSKVDAEDGLQKDLATRRPLRITNKNLVDYIFIRSLEIAVEFHLPMQIHTGFGDRDVELRNCTPFHLRSLLEDKRFAKCQIVLLNASYPFSREASYLASVYSQVYLDFGFAFPKLSVQGITSSLKELLERAPIKKVMFSTDGYAFPETYYLGAKWARDIVYRVLLAACEDGDLTIQEAIEAVEDILRRNALHLYKLDVVHEKVINIDDNSTSSSSCVKKDDVILVRMVWNDASGQHRCRALPAERFYGIARNKGVGLGIAAVGFTSFRDAPAAGTNLTCAGEEIRLVADMSTLLRIPWSRNEEMVMADMITGSGEASEYCPRNALRKVIKVLLDEFNVTVMAGFENEFYLLRKSFSEGHEQWVPYDNSSYCSTSAFDGASSILKEAYSCLKAAEIVVEQMHAEGGNGQFEIALKYVLCTLAADNQIYAREIIKSVARKHGVIATFLPKPDLNELGSGCHVHLSLWENDQNVFMGSNKYSYHGMSNTGERFLAGVYHHLPSILAFTAPHPHSYDRIQPHTFTGAYLCWGKENREAPLRTSCPPGVPPDFVSNFEVRSFDGCANPHLGLAAIVTAGIDGLRRGLKLPPPTELNPADCASHERLPHDLLGSAEALAADEIFHELMGDKLVTSVIAMRKAEIEHYAKNPVAVHHLIHRY